MNHTLYLNKARALRGAERLELDVADDDHRTQVRAIKEKYRAERRILDSERDTYVKRPHKLRAATSLAFDMRNDADGNEIRGERHIDRAQVIAWAMRYKLPTNYIEREIVRNGWTYETAELERSDARPSALEYMLEQDWARNAPKK